MELRFTNDWLRRQIEKDADSDCEAGLPLRDAAPIEQFASPNVEQAVLISDQKSVVLSLLVHQLRRRDQLTVAQLADRIRVDPKDIESIEANPDFVPSPRTMHMIAQYINVPTTAVQRIAASIDSRNDNVKEAALKFAASSDDLSSLSRSERRSLNDFVKVLSSYKSE